MAKSRLEEITMHELGLLAIISAVVLAGLVIVRVSACVEATANECAKMWWDEPVKRSA